MRRDVLAGIVGLLVGGLFALTLPAYAHHITEPTAPVTGLTLVMGEYPGLRNDPIGCAAGQLDTFDGRALRIEPRVSVAASPSEHWTFKLSVVDPSGRSRWDARWTHQNSAPHGGPSWEAVQANDYQVDLDPGVWTVRALVQGDVSGNRFEQVCTFQAVSPPGE